MASRVELSDHARHEAVRRQIDEATVLAVADSPEQVVPVRAGREVRQARVVFPAGGGTFLVRVVVDVGQAVDTVVTVYRTSKIEKYWRLS